MKVDLSFIVVFLNEENNLVNICKEIKKIELLLPDLSYEIVLVNDGSSDRSWEIASELAKDANENIKAISFIRNFGAIEAVIAGIQESNGRFLVDMAADGQEPIELFANLYKNNIEEKVEVSWGVRTSRKDPWLSNLFSKLNAKIMQTFAIKNYPNEGLDAFCISRKIGQYLLDNYTATSNLHNLIYWAGHKSGRVPYERKERTSGKSKWTTSKKINLFINSFVSFSYFPLRLLTIVGILFSFFGFIWGSYIVIYRVFFGFPIEGWASVIAILFFGLGITNLCLGIIAEYIWRILANINPKPLFIIDKIIENTRDES